MTKAAVSRPESSPVSGEAIIIKHSQQRSSRKHLNNKRRQKCIAVYPSSEIHATIATPSTDEAFHHAKTTSFIRDDQTGEEYLSLVARRSPPWNSGLDCNLRKPIEDGMHQYEQSIDLAVAAAPTMPKSGTAIAELRTECLAQPYYPHRNRGDASETNTLSVASNLLYLPPILSQVTTGPCPSSHLDFLLSNFQKSIERTILAAPFLPVITGARGASLPNPDAQTCLPQNPFEQAFVQPSQHQFPKYNCGIMNMNPTSEHILADPSQQIPREGLLLACPEDRGMLNDHLILLRRQIEFFQATPDDIMSLTRGRNKGIALRQVGVRCRHCSHIPAGQRRKGSTYFPSTLMGIYQAAQNINIEHLQSGICPEMQEEAKVALLKTRADKRAASGIGKAYWAESARVKGLVDTEVGILFAGDGVRSLLLPTSKLS